MASKEFGFWSAMWAQGQTFLLIEHIYKRAVFYIFLIFRSLINIFSFGFLEECTCKSSVRKASPITRLFFVYLIFLLVDVK